MSGGEDTKANELVIIRRRSSNDDGGGKGGGVWKIAYADFMTAMMAFFLVMWLINSTDKKVLTQIANYFNPVRLTDKTQMPRGLHENESGARGSQRELGNSEEQDGKAKSSYKAEAGKPKYTEEMLFADPYGTLSKLAVQAGGSARGAEVEAAGGGGEAYRDPFDPAFVRERFHSAAREVAPGADRSSDAPDKGASEPKQRTQKEPSADKRQGGAASSAVDNAPESAAEKLIEPTAKSYPGVRTRAEAAKLEADIKGALDRTPFGTFPQIEVTVSEDGTLISLMDDQNFGMFAIASAEPRPATVVIMEKIASVLAGRKERLVIRGHTDGRPYKSQTYDNWRLSTARAHMARFMLVRGGVQDKRFDRIEGHADRDLRIPDNAEAAPNRRIEILLRKGT